MKEKKELKKLNLEKEEIINLNEYEMDAVKGGSTPACVSAVTAVITAIKETYEFGEARSLWTCGAAPTPTPTPTPAPTPAPTIGGNCGCTLAPTMSTTWEL